MLHLKVIFLLSYFIIIFLSFRAIELCAATLHNEFTFHTIFKTYSSMIKNYFFMEATVTDSSVEKSTDEFTIKEQQTIRHTAGEEDAPVEEMFFQGYGDYVEKVEDTKASVWVVKIIPSAQHLVKMRRRTWNKLSVKLKKNGIKTGTYYCHQDIRLCLVNQITTTSLLLSMPKGSHPKGNVVFHSFSINENDHIDLADDVFTWVQAKLFPKVKTVHSISELTEPPVTRLSKTRRPVPSMFFVYESNKRTPPLFLTSLSVRFTGRIKFYLLKSHGMNSEENDKIYAMNKYAKYTYGDHKGENFSYSCMELFLRTLHPEVNDIFIASLILLNMACWLEVSLQNGGPLRRLLFYVWGFLTSNILLFSVWLPLLQIIYLPEVQPILEMCLKSLQDVMFTNIAAIIRQDLLLLSKHIHIVFIGFVCYGIFLGYIHFKFKNHENSNSFSMIVEHDIEDIRNIFQSLLDTITPTLRIYRFETGIERILQHLTTSNIWLPIDTSTEYIKYLPNWKHCAKEYQTPIEVISDSELWHEQDSTDDCSSSTDLEPIHSCHYMDIPSYVFPSQECVICLERYKCKQSLIGLPCGHSFHRICVVEWLLSGSSNNRCPVCRWPCNIQKGKIEVIDVIE